MSTPRMPDSIHGYAIMPGGNARSFLHDPSNAYREAVDALRKLDLDTAERAFAEAVHDQWAAEWLESRNVTLSRGEQWVGPLLGKRGRYDDEGGVREHIPGCEDHISLWNKDGKPALFVCQPYHADVHQLVHWCEERGLRASVQARRSWWFPGSTLLIEVSRPDEEPGDD